MNTPVQATNSVEVLERALEVLSAPNAWIKGNMATDAIGNIALPYEPHATCFCILGALERGAHGVLESDQVGEYYAIKSVIDAEVEAQKMVGRVLYSRCGSHSIPHFNDYIFTTHGEVISIMTQALADARKTVA